jgi:endonuclease YncB( thermonuclease family)
MILGAFAVATNIASLSFYRTRNSSIALTEEWIVTDVVDGTTITVRQTDGSQMKVRLCGIDTLKQGRVSEKILSNAARDKLRSLLGLPKASLVASAEQQVLIIPVTQDTEGYTIAEVISYTKGETEINFQEELLKSGLAKIYTSGANCPNYLAFEEAQQIAITSKLGIWK